MIHSKDFLVFALVLALCRTKKEQTKTWGPSTEDIGPRGQGGEGGHREHHVARMLGLPGFI